MALQVWLPLDGDLRNQGLDGSKIPSLMGSGITYTEGKIGQAATFPNNCNSCIHMPGLRLQTGSFAAWLKVNGAGGSSRQCLISEGRDSYNDGVEIYTSQAGTTLYFKAHEKILSTTIELNKWYHIVGTFGNQKIQLFLNGELKSSNTYTTDMTYQYASDLTLGKMSYFYNSTSNYFAFNGKLNDVRIYDHALSYKEVKELAKGLILHYRLSKPMPNLLKNGAFTSLTTGNTGLGTGIYATSWGGYNNGISNPTTNYHACIDQNTFGYPVYMYNETNGSRNWKGISQSISKNLIEGSTDYIFSCDVYQTLSGGKIFGGFYYKKTGATSSSFASGQYTISASMIPKGNWTKISIKVPFNDNIDSSVSSVSFYIYGYGFSDNGIVYIKNVKLEKGTKATTFIPNESDTLYSAMGYNSNIEPDCSGYKRDGIIIGTLIAAADTPRYRTCGNIINNSSYIKVDNLQTSGFNNSYSFSWWGKISSFSGRMFWGFSNGIRLNGVYNGNLWNTGDSSNNPLYVPGTTTQITVPSVNIWHHFVMTGDGTNCKLYLDGKYYGIAKTYKGISGTTLIINGWDTGTSYSGQINISDFRIYATALSADDIKALYNDSASIDKNGNFHAYEYVEDDSRVNINKQGVFTVPEEIMENSLKEPSIDEKNIYAKGEFYED